VQPPAWLRRDFVNTNWKIGGDDGWEEEVGVKDGVKIDVGPGVSIEQTFTVWKRILKGPATTLLGSLTTESPPPSIKVGRSMYGIVVTPLQGDRTID
jgi:hypothetical protein